MAGPSKAQLLNEVLTLLKKRYKIEPRGERLSTLEAIVFGICHEDTTREQANQALSRFKDDFFDWNEVRVSSVPEIQSVLAGLPNAERRANAIRKVLRQLFNKTYSFTLDGLGKKPLKEAVKILQEYESIRNDYVLATVIQLALGGHALPVDASVRRVMERLGVADAEVEASALRSTLERAIPKNRGEEFVDLVEELAHDTCVQENPDCPRCDLRKICPAGQENLTAAKSASKAAVKAAKNPPSADAPIPVEKSTKRKPSSTATPEPTPTSAATPEPTPNPKTGKGKPPRGK